MYGALLVPVVHGKLPPEIRKNIAREHGSHNICLIELRKSIVIEISILEIGQTTDYGVNRMTATCLLERSEDNNLFMTINRQKCQSRHMFAYFVTRNIKLAKDLKITTTAEMERHYFTSSSVNMDHNELHVFVDACMSAYGAVAYIFNVSHLVVVMAKNCVAPLKKLTLPQLELMEAPIGARLSGHTRTTLPSNKVVFWSDNQIVLHWLNTSRQLKRFVQNRTNEIRNLTAQDEWRYCPIKENLADLLTRGLTAERFLQNALWFNGHELLTDEKNGRHGSQRSQIVPYNHPS
ncbi:unnamed protein product [Mytilus coruscus]|uniref:Uncharacterized protein n=1 Tax=Mytilus coruscus TaxID=42192 RepID=A0A6J8ET59_MYTCO|nr:unnamed protein product [Mytilus coruscus]